MLTCLKPYSVKAASISFGEYFVAMHSSSSWTSCSEFLASRCARLYSDSACLMNSTLLFINIIILTTMIPALPSRDDLLQRSTAIWLKEKAAYDRQRTGVPPDLWYVNGKIYDLSGFMSVHPGGKELLQLTRGQDVTEFFMTHHLKQEKCRAVLAKYYVRDAERRSQIFSFEEDGFYRTLQRKVALHFESKSTGPSRLMVQISFLTLMAFLFCLIQTSLRDSYFWAVLTGLCLHVIYGLGHTYIHQGSNQHWRFLFDLTLSSHASWYVTHCISHHHFPNTLIDLELSSMEPFLMYIRSKQPNCKFMWCYYMFFAGFVSLFEHLIVLISRIKERSPLRAEMALPIAQYLVLAAGSTQPLTLLLLMHFISSFLLLFVSLIVHRTTYHYTDGVKQAAEKDFGQYILQSTTDYNTHIRFPWNLVLFEGFNDHILHHLFPTINICHLGELHKYLNETLKEFKLERRYKDFGFWELQVAHVNLLNRKEGEIRYSPLG